MLLQTDSRSPDARIASGFEMITTSRYASVQVRKCAKSLADIMDSTYVARTKKTVYDIASYARRKGHERIIIISDSGKAEFLSVDELGAWERIGEMRFEYAGQD